MISQINLWKGVNCLAWTQLLQSPKGKHIKETANTVLELGKKKKRMPLSHDIEKMKQKMRNILFISTPKDTRQSGDKRANKRNMHQKDELHASQNNTSSRVSSSEITPSATAVCLWTSLYIFYLNQVTSLSGSIKMACIKCIKLQRFSTCCP